MKVVVLNNEFKVFCEESKGLGFDEKVKLWDRHIESKYQDLYDCIVWDKKIYKDNWEGHKQYALKDSFKKYESSSEDILNSFKKINSTINSSFSFFEKEFPNIVFTSICFAKKI